ncbi:uncharacterized protein ColSpa_10241 [Colletotrichum spaethianum]|uniref:Uncharacterized protein n=1 Tax=Colletotrichum spaethianum TaxID=700344 RepID=A0AA37PD34_9PEZI|nr:uncharacterized protein ColSpa_10241 [Colletotrichum spaethianum]GKT50060.1 hypothetical protein ColSpa_10241 [Colletotrichum spaethianum]
MSRAYVDIKDVTLGIDIGSTSTRAYLRCPATKEEWYVENPSDELIVTNGDFSSAGYPFRSKGPVYLGERADPTSQAVSLKYAFYPLADASDELLEQYHLVRSLMERKSDAKFLDRLRQGLEELLAVIKCSVDDICTRQRIKVTRIGLSIPSQWTLEFEDVYKNIVSSVFGHSQSSIFFHTETEALAHYLLDEGLDYLLPDQHSEYRVFLFLDLGGHNMVSLLFPHVHLSTSIL